MSHEITRRQVSAALTKGKPERMTLKQCLKILGVSRRKTSQTNNGFLPHKGASETWLWDLFDEAKRCWLSGVKRIRTDFAENHEAAAIWNGLWRRAKELFQRKGIGADIK